jgi:hypothetical protein
MPNNICVTNFRERLGSIVAQLKRKLWQLGFQTRADFAIVHRGAAPGD